MLYQRFTIVCLLSMLFGIGFAMLVQDGPTAHRKALSIAACPPQSGVLCTISR